MKKLFFTAICIIAIAITGCKKKGAAEELPGNTTATSEQDVLNDFANILVNPNYVDIQAKANALNGAVQTFNGTSTDVNLTAARDAWRAVRVSWELSEAYLFGPVEDFNYDPEMDDWPVNRVDMDSLLAGSNALSLSDIDALPTSLKGFHPMEYMLFGEGGTKIATDFTVREKLYLVSLAQSLYNTTTDLRNSWDVSSGNFTTELTTAGKGSTRFATRKEAFMAIVNAMAGICDEVGGGKMEDPLSGGPGGLPDSTLEESQFSHNSTTDFKNNITGIRNAYLCKYFADGHGLNELVAAKNISLDNTLQSQMTIAINAFNAVNANYGIAVYNQAVQIHNVQSAIGNLRHTLENDLMDFIQTNIKD